MVRPGIRRAFRLALFRGESLRSAVREELEHHVRLSVEHLMAQGYTAEAARAEAHRRLGPIEEVQESLYETARYRESRMRLHDWLDAAWIDLRYAARRLRLQAGVTLVVVVTLSLGIGANAAIFPMLDRLWFREPGGVDTPSTVRRGYAAERGEQGRTEVRNVFSYPELGDVRDALRGVADVAGYFPSSISVAGDSAAERRVGMAYISAELLPLLGVRMERGRGFTSDEGDPARPALVAIVSHELWQTRLGANPNVVGSQVRLGSREFTVIGVTAREFAGIDVAPTHVWLPLPVQRQIFSSRGNWWDSRSVLAWQLILRVRDPERAAGVVAAGTTALRTGAADPTAPRGADQLESRLELGSIIEARGPKTARLETQIATRLGGLSLLLFLIAIANVTNLLLGRAARRRREVAVQSALGIGRARLAASFILDAACLAVLAGAAALACGALTTGIVRALLLPNTPWTPPAIDPRAVLFTATLAFIAAVIAGGVPAVNAMRVDPGGQLRKAGGHGTQRGTWLRTGLLVSQAALSALLLVGAGLFIASLDRVRQVDAGYDLAPLAAVNWRGETPPRAVLDDVRARVAALPGVEATALASVTPLRGLGSYTMYLPGRDTALSEAFTPDFSGITPEYFRATGLTIKAGRAFDARDRAGASPVMIINEESARVLWPAGDAIGACVRLESATAACHTIVGIAENTRRFKVLEEPAMQAYAPLEQLPDGDPPRALLIRATGDLTAATRVAEAELRPALGPSGVTNTFLYRDWLEPQLGSWKLGARLFGIVATLSLLLAVAGLYCVVTYSVSERAHELGIRMALGATTRGIVHHVLLQGLRAVTLGLALGLLAAALAGRLIASVLYETSTHDPLVYIAVAITLIFAGTLATLIPAWRAGRLDPLVALRAE